MPYLDAIRLFFESVATVEDEDSIFGKDWGMTLQYVLHTPGLNFACTSRFNAQRDLWVFLVWENEADRQYFYHQTAGVGFMSEHMVKPPSIFLFVDGQYDGLFKSERWRIDIVSADADRARSLKSTVEEDRLKGNLQNADFVSLQENEALQTLYDGNSFDAAFIALRRTDDHPAMTLECEFNWEQYLVELEICQKRSYPTLKNAEAPSDIAGLARKQPWEYGVLSSDQSQYADTAYPMSLTFRPMAALSMANKFLPDSTALSVSDIATTYEYAAAIIQVKVRSLSQLNVKSARELRENVGLQDVDGLCELSILTNADDRDNVCFLTVWKSAKDLAIYRQKHTANQYTGHDIVSSCTVTHDWTSNAIGLQQLEWESSHMVVDKILELVEFRFAKALKLTEKKAFMYRIYDLINTMCSTWSGDVDSQPVVYPEDPIWAKKTDSAPSCLLFLAWDGPSQRAAWLRNFMAHDFTWTGHIAYILGAVCTSVESTTYSMEKLYTWRPDLNQSPDENEENDSDYCDGGF